MDIDDVTGCEFPEDVKEYLEKARIHEAIDSIPDLRDAGFWYRKAADRLWSIGKLKYAGEYFDKAADYYAKAAQKAKREKRGEDWNNAYSSYTRARAAYQQFGFVRYSVRRIYVKETDALRKANKYHKEFAKGTNWLEKAWLFVLKYLCNYGMRPSQLVAWIVGIILIFTFAYYPSSYGFIELRSAEGQVWTDSFWSNFTTSLHFSVITFTTLGYGNIYPVGKAAYLITAFESILGYFFWGLLLATLAKKILVF